jgi:hypothetical protein
LRIRYFILLACALVFSSVKGQMCPGGGLTFSSAVPFDASWIYGCNTGTSCNGGVNFDNRIACEPTSSMEACAPAPTCGTIANNASDIWFKFYATATTATISCFQNTSFVIGVQAFSGGSTCGSLTQIGCALAGGPSSGVQLQLSGLTVGELYYYRIYGSSPQQSQRSGIYCFCGSTGLDNYVLASGLESFKGNPEEQSIKLTWGVSRENMPAEFDIQLSSDKRTFNTISTVKTSYNRHEYSYSFEPGDNRDLYYRLRFLNASGEISYSPILRLKIKGSVENSFTYLKQSGQLRINLDKPSSFILYTTSGKALETYSFNSGEQAINTRGFAPGVYFLKNTQSNKVQKIALYN